MKVDTNPMVHSVPSIINLPFSNSAACGTLSCDPDPGTFGLMAGHSTANCRFDSSAFTIVNAIVPILRLRLFEIERRYISVILSMAGRELDHVNISGRCRDNASPAPEGSACPVFCCRSVPGRAWRERHPISSPTPHSSTFPVALFCKAQTATSYSLY